MGTGDKAIYQGKGQKTPINEPGKKFPGISGLAQARLTRGKPVRGPEPYIFMVSTLSDIEVPEPEVIAKTGSRHRLYSFVEVRKNMDRANERLKIKHDQGCRFFLDSGAFTFQQRFIKPVLGKVKRYDLLTDVSEEREKFENDYVDYCKEYGHQFECYANFDYKIVAAWVYEKHMELQSRGIRPVPTIHGDDGLDWIRKYRDDGHQYIAVSRGKRFGRGREPMTIYLDKVFNMTAKLDVEVHGLAITDAELMYRYPFYSADSSAWIQARAMGMIYIVAGGRLNTVHVSGGEHDAKDKKQMEWVKEFVESHGFDFEAMKYHGKEKEPNRLAWQTRGVFNIFVMQNMKKLGWKLAGGGRAWKSLLG